MKVFQIQNTLYQIQTLLNKYKIYFLPTTEHLYVAPNNRIAKTYQNHNTRPHTKYKQHTPYQIQNECIATIHQLQSHGKNNTHIILHTKYRKTLILLNQIQNIAAPRTYAKYRTLNAARYRQNTAASKYVHISAGICTSQLQLSVDSVPYPDYVSVV